MAAKDSHGLKYNFEALYLREILRYRWVPLNSKLIYPVKYFELSELRIKHNPKKNIKVDLLI